MCFRLLGKRIVHFLKNFPKDTTKDTLDNDTVLPAELRIFFFSHIGASEKGRIPFPEAEWSVTASP
ncbi:hypothetical protein SAMN04488090_4964 [Siphonobacter aquaeclarae]|uniref:Uncharacterized protein n=1 Tax=Siphonobacter aquaeclarae TaxID=563176 RepID=A0A1G9YM31_9BACT|nr:hypothetical protein SAMN04488090_4964 [Siphonobacter aquaeclarae]